MKKILFFLLLGLFVAGSEASSRSPHPWNDRGNFGLFYSSLSPYGEWIQLEAGYVWRPLNVSHGWRPYLYGQWVWSDYGWYWVSQEPFGWATFHYGRWLYDDYYGWIWTPDDVWGPAWVEWRYDDMNIGWAPLTPYAAFRFNIGIVLTSHWVSPIHYWNFIPCRYFTTHRIIDYVQPIERARRFFGNTRSAVNIEGNDRRIINRGVDINFIQRRTNSRIERVDVVARERGQGDRLVRSGNRSRVEAFRPRLESDTRQVTRPETFRQDERRRPDAGQRWDGRGAQRQEQTAVPQVERERLGRREIPREPQQRQEEQRKFYEQRQQQREQVIQEQRRSRDAQVRPEPQRQQSRQQPVQRPDNSRGGREGRRRP